MILITPCVYVLVYTHHFYWTDTDIVALTLPHCLFFCWAVSSTSWRCTSRDNHRARQLRVSGYGGPVPWKFIFHASMKQADLRSTGAKSQGCRWVVQCVVEFVLVKVNLGDAQQRIINVHKVHSPSSQNSSFPLNLIRSYHHLLYTYDMILYLHTSRIIQRGSREGFLPDSSCPSVQSTNAPWKVPTALGVPGSLRRGDKSNLCREMLMWEMWRYVWDSV